MKKIYWFAVCWSPVLASTCLAADGKSVSYKSGDETVQALLYTPAGNGPFPAHHRHPRVVGAK